MKYFSIQEMCNSARAKRDNIDNTPDEISKANLIALVDNVLDPLRSVYGKPITVTSGYRCPNLNKSVGGVKTSQHQRGEAADISVFSKEGNRALFNIIREQLPFDQLINEKDFSWIHVSYKKSGRNRKEVLAL